MVHIPIGEEHIEALRGVARKHGHGRGLAVHNLHRHDPIPEQTIRLESAIDNVLADSKLTMAVPIDKVDIGNTHRTLYRFEGDQVVPYEFAKGKSPVSPADLSMKCVADVFTYIATHGLEDDLALQLSNFPAPGEGGPWQVRAEIEVDGIGTLMVAGFNVVLAGNIDERATVN